MAENDTGFVNSGYINKKGTTSGDSLNVMPPGMDVGNQPNADVSADMKMKKIVPLGFPGSGQSE